MPRIVANAAQSAQAAPATPVPHPRSRSGSGRAAAADGADDVGDGQQVKRAVNSANAARLPAESSAAPAASFWRRWTYAEDNARSARVTSATRKSAR